MEMPSFINPPYRKKGLIADKRKGRRKIRIGVLPERLYLELVNLKSDDEIKSFIGNHLFTVPKIVDGKKQPALASVADIKEYQDKFKTYNQNISNLRIETERIRKENSGIRSKKYAIKQAGRIQISLYFTDEMINDMNLHLVDCHPAINILPWIKKGDPNSLLDKLEMGKPSHYLSLPPYYINCFLQPQWKTDNTVAICYGELFDDLISQQLIRICKNCGRLFQAENYSQQYCATPKCVKERAKKRQKKSSNNA